MGLTTKILAFSASLVLALTLTTLGFTAHQADRLARENITRGLTETPKQWEAFEADRYRKLRLALAALAADPAFGAAVRSGDIAVISERIGARTEVEPPPRLLIVMDTAGVVLARSDRPDAGSENLSSVPFVARALSGTESAAVWRRGPDLYHAVSVPLRAAGTSAGALVAAQPLDRAAAEELRRLTRADFAFLVAGAVGGGRLSASSLGPREGALASLLSLGRFRPEAPGAAPVLHDVDLAGDHYLAAPMPLGSPGDGPVGWVLALCNHSEELASFRHFRNSLVAASLAFTVLAMGLAFGAARRLAGPLRTLTDRVERARDGSYVGAVAVRTSDEVGTLARAFNRLLADLREKEQLVRFLRERGSRPTPVTTSPAETVDLGVAPAPARVLDVGSVLGGRYEVQARVGRGGMGVVFRALDRRLSEVVALKVLRPELVAGDPTLAERFKQEIRLARRITHPNVLRTHDLVEIGGLLVISMEYVEGAPLKTLLRQRGALPVGVGRRIGRQICRGLDAAHRTGVVHRDVKPQNMLIVPETGDLKIMDFGIARVADGRAGGLTATGAVFGTPDYMAPEQAQGRPADVRSDVYSLGVVLFEMFTGRLPFVADSVTGILLKQVQAAPPSPRALNESVPEPLAALILRCLEKDPARRVQSAREVGERLARIAEGSGTSASRVA